MIHKAIKAKYYQKTFVCSEVTIGNAISIWYYVLVIRLKFISRKIKEKNNFHSASE